MSGPPSKKLKQLPLFAKELNTNPVAEGSQQWMSKLSLWFQFIDADKSKNKPKYTMSCRICKSLKPGGDDRILSGEDSFTFVRHMKVFRIEGSIYLVS